MMTVLLHGVVSVRVGQEQYGNSNLLLNAVKFKVNIEGTDTVALAKTIACFRSCMQRQYSLSIGLLRQPTS